MTREELSKVRLGQRLWCSIWRRREFQPVLKQIIGLDRTIPFAKFFTGEHIHFDNIFLTEGECQERCERLKKEIG